MNLLISIVVYHPNVELVTQLVGSLKDAREQAFQVGVVNAIKMIIVDNGDDPVVRKRLHTAISELWGEDWIMYVTKRNVGFGAGHNLAFAAHPSDYFLVLNPDVEVDRETLIHALRYLKRNSNVGCLSPHCEGSTGLPEYLCKRYPNVLDLLIRGFLPKTFQSYFSIRLARYELRGVTEDQVVVGIPIVSGCFMMFRSEVFAQVKGFDEAYFLYFEDFDLSMRISPRVQIAYVPEVKIVHYGGYAARKGIYHIVLFVVSGVRFFATHGWRFW